MKTLTAGILSFILLISCSEKKNNEKITDDKTAHDTTNNTTAPHTALADSIPVIGFPLDSLLKFESEDALKKVFGQNVQRSIGYYPEGMGEYKNTLLFPNTANEIEFVWLDTVAFKNLDHIQIEGKATGWKTAEGITLGTRMKELEKLNKKPFTFAGFDWDYSGTTTWEEGHLESRKIYVSLDFPDDADMKDLDSLVGDQPFASESPLAQKVNPVVREITMVR